MARRSQLLVSTLDLDEEGFLRHPDIWNENVAQLLAQEEVPEGLTEEHWRVIKHLRDYYLEFGIPPPVAKLRKDTGFNLKRIYGLFSSGLGKGAVKIAGLPRPPGLYPP